jgi:hypothetical protein
MPVERERFTDSELFHYRKRNTVRQRIFFVFVLLEIFPTLLKQHFINVDEPNRRTSQQPFSYVDCLFMMSAIIEEGDDFVEDVRSGYNQGKRFDSASPVL